MNCKVKTIPERLFADCQNLSEVTLPAALEKIDDYAFFQCNELTLSNIPETVEVIGKSAFKGTQVSNLRLNCSQIGENAFMGCFNLQSITFSDNLQKISAGAFIDSMVDEFVLPENANRRSVHKKRDQNYFLFFSPNMIKYLYKTMEGGKNREESSAYERDIRS